MRNDASSEVNGIESTGSNQKIDNKQSYNNNCKKMSNVQLSIGNSNNSQQHDDNVTAIVENINNFTVASVMIPNNGIVTNLESAAEIQAAAKRRTQSCSAIQGSNKEPQSPFSKVKFFNSTGHTVYFYFNLFL